MIFYSWKWRLTFSFEFLCKINEKGFVLISLHTLTPMYSATINEIRLALNENTINTIFKLDSIFLFFFCFLRRRLVCTGSHTIVNEKATRQEQPCTKENPFELIGSRCHFHIDRFEFFGV